MKSENGSASSQSQLPESERRVRANREDILLASNLQQLLFGLAKQLLSVGITPAYFADLAAHAFVKAAAGVSKCRNGRVNSSRVAVLTSLRRAQVRRLLTRVDGDTEWVSRIGVPRTERVLAGWTTDRRYLKRDGSPRRLSLHGQPISFASLVKSFAGDVPPRAVLDELRRLEAVRETGQYVVLTGERRQKPSVFKSVQGILEILLDSMAVADPLPSRPRLNPSLQRVSLSAVDILDLEVKRERVSMSASAFIEGLKSSLDLPTSPPRRSKRMQHELTVTVVVRARRKVRGKGTKS